MVLTATRWAHVGERNQQVLQTYWCSVLAVLVGNLLHCRVAHEVGGLVTPVLHGCAVWGTQGRVGSQVNALQIYIPD